jgi:glycosyltransferase involved in cell wall biosynthesis
VDKGEPVASAKLRRTLFWSAIGAFAYTYVVFPLVLLLRAALFPRPHAAGGIMPTVTIVIAAHNEAANIRAKLVNLLSLDYPDDRLEILIASDGSDDGTDEIVRSFQERGVRLLTLPRVGKAAALNAGVAAAAGEILVFSDANSIYAPDSLHALVRPFADATVGGVAGDQRYVDADDADAVVSGERSYWDLERRLKTAESLSGNVISATGAIYAIRRSLVQPIPGGVTDDFFTSTGVIAQGRRLVFAPSAVAYEPVSKTAEIELGRKVRVMTRGLRAVLARRELLDPRRHGFYSLQLFTHKVLRRTMVFPLLGLAVTSPLLWRRGAFYRAATVAQVAVYGLGAAGTLLAGRPVARRKALALPAFFTLVNLASLRAVSNVVRGRSIERWEPRRPEATAHEGVPVGRTTAPSAGS